MKKFYLTLMLSLACSVGYCFKLRGSSTGGNCGCNKPPRLIEPVPNWFPKFESYYKFNAPRTSNYSPVQENKPKILAATNNFNGITVVLLNTPKAKGVLEVKNSKGEVEMEAYFTGSYESREPLAPGKYTLTIHANNKVRKQEIIIRG